MSSSQNTQSGFEFSPTPVAPPFLTQAIQSSSSTPFPPTAPPTKRRRNAPHKQTPSSKLPKPAHSKNPSTPHPTHTSTKKTTTATDEQKRAKRLLKRMQKAERKDSRSDLVLTAAHFTISILQTRGISCAMFGSLACKLYGEFRHPKDVDVLVLQPPTCSHSDEELKKLIADADPNHFYLKLPRNPEAPYRILYYREDQLECKVDILTPGTMHLPPLQPPPPASQSTSSPNNHINITSGIPLIPFSLLLLHKLQGWSDHRSAPEQFKRHKQHQDAADIRRLLAMTDLIKPLQHTRPWTNTDLFSPEFQVLTKQRVKDYCKEFPTRAQSWKLLGFETE